MDHPIVTRLLREQILDIWGKGQVALVAQNYAPDVIDHMPIPGQTAGRDDLANVVRDFRQLIPDLTMTLHGTIACGNRGADFWTLNGTQYGKAVSFSGIDIIEVAQGQITELWHVEEMLQYGDQIGAAATACHAPRGATSGWAGPDPDHDPGRHARLPDPGALSVLERRNLGIARDHIETIWAKGDMTAA